MKKMMKIAALAVVTACQQTAPTPEDTMMKANTASRRLSASIVMA